MPAPLTEFREAIKSVLVAELGPELPGGVRDDKLHESLGTDGAVAGVYPEAEATADTGLDSNYLIVVQVFMRYELQVNPAQRVDPAAIEDLSWRFQRALKDNASVDTVNAWWFTVARVDYGDDPTGNKSRFSMMIQGHGPTASLAETEA